VNHPVTVGAQEDKIAQLGRLASGEFRDWTGVVALNKAFATFPIRCLEVETTSLTAQLPMQL
jgi:hypothetical protein